jgi:hypothetical protein
VSATGRLQPDVTGLAAWLAGRPMISTAQVTRGASSPTAVTSVRISASSLAIFTNSSRVPIRSFLRDPDGHLVEISQSTST